ncbi:hypothetical protein [Bacillus rhizoplanae]|uniref:hypothetical protein n=1 Tax=Bacillus rhizoplanae TaxID=2880966 RepID=UPI003D234100
MNKYSLLLFDLDDTLLDSTWFNVGLIKTLEMHPITRNLDASVFLEKKLHIPKSLLERFENRELTPAEFRRARWKHAFAHFNALPERILLPQACAERWLNGRWEMNFGLALAKKYLLLFLFSL